ncbi:N(G),N(G)-dimethylarginine dimethylaminohydrolase [Aquisphaera giovannonii]|uniref:N(G),N(G)-dimethylarginine dimethylaminohydrolase n=1 Tax=Aquisphaera giovannonii TaxID=406548 RepID=A0A5B9WBL0_9BACT|nr:arginine deiminase-related protein [Aquisphaera giovannonii]QEH37401.1 N(G),N(G)-dimethylarginine dimethylaminohydrolase [Aquisphaera giovannonii]
MATPTMPPDPRGPRPRLLMCPPDHFGIEYEINPWMDVTQGSDAAIARRQWQALREAVVALGAEVELLEPAAGLPDLVFTANAGLVFRGLFLPSRFRFGVRQGESPLFERWAREHGFEVVPLPEGMYFEGAGDALFCGETLFAGYRFRSDVRGHQWVGERLGVSVLPLELVDPRFYHLDTCFCPIAPDAAIYYPGAFDEYGRSVIRDQVPRLAEVSAEEAASFSCNAVVVGRTVVLNRGAPKLAATLGAMGFDTRPLEFSEFIKSGGSAKCLTLRLDGEEAAAWKSSPAAG